MSSTLYLSKIPLALNCIAISKAVCPPTVGRITSGFSFFIISSIADILIGSRYVASAMFLSVIIVAGLELTRITLYPSCLSARQACVPE